MTSESRNAFSGSAHFVIQARDVGTVNLPSAPAPTSLQRAAGELAAIVHAQWRDEAGMRGLISSVPMEVGWEADWSAADHRGKVGEVSPAGSGLPALAAAFSALPQRRLAILGPSGAGKTSLAILLVLELLGGRGPDEPVPVILPLVSWNPDKDHLDAWLSRRILEDYGARASELDPRTVRRLVRDRRVLPVLEGLDELPARRAAKALAGINRALGPGDPVVLTSRGGEYTAAVRAGRVLDSAAVIQARPVTRAAAEAYLSAAVQPQRLGEWAPVLRALGGGPVGKALSSPLMLWLATTVYAGPGTRPAELADRTVFRNARSIEEHLLDGLIPAVFTDVPPSPDRLHPARQWPADRAHRWLTYLAGELSRDHTRDVMWWRLRLPGLPARARRTVIVIGALLFGALTYGIAFTFTRLVLPDLPRTPDGSRTVVVVSVAGIVGMFSSIMARMVSGMSDDLPGRPARPRRLALIAAVAPIAWAVSLVVPPKWMMLGGSMLMLGVVVAATRRVSGGTSTGPDGTLRGERLATWTGALLPAPLIGFCTVALPLRPLGGEAMVGGGLAGWFCAAVGIAVTGRWAQWLLTRWSLGVAGLMPHRTMAFLGDARRLGVLRESGGVYQFRHARLQRRLAARPAPSGDGPAEVHVSTRVRLDRTWTSVINWLLVAGIGVSFVAYELWTDGRLIFPTLLLLVVVLRRPRGPRIGLRADASAFDVTYGRTTRRYRWRDVAAVEVRDTEALGYAIKVRLKARAKVPKDAVKDEHGWYTIWFLGASPEVPRDIADALTRFAGDRWTESP